jgi:tetratricopeptide (TPR) repeat protein
MMRKSQDKQAAVESVRRAVTEMLDFSDSEERVCPPKFTALLEDALGTFDAPDDLFTAQDTFGRDDAQLLGEIEKEVRQFDSALGSLCGNPGIYLRLGNSAYLQKENTIALENYDKALRISPKCSEAWKGKGCIHLRHLDYSAAQSCFDRALSEEPDNPEILYSLAFATGSLGKLTDAMEMAERALSLNPQVIRLTEFLNASIATEPAALRTFTKEFLN